MQLSLNDALGCGLRFNLGLIDSRTGSAAARAARMHALSLLLPDIEASARASFVEFSTIPEGGAKLGLPLSVGPFNYQSSGVSVS